MANFSFHSFPNAIERRMLLVVVVHLPGVDNGCERKLDCTELGRHGNRGTKAVLPPDL